MSEETKNEGLFTISEPTLSSFPNIDKPRAVKRKGKDTGEPKYSLSWEFEPDSEVLKALKAKIVAVARAAKPGIDVKTLKLPITSGDKLADKAKEKGKDREWSRGKVVLTARSKYPPRAGHIVSGAVVEIEVEPNSAAIKKSFYTGVLALGEVNFQYYDPINDGDPPGVTAYLNSVLSLDKGKRLTGGKSMAETFKGYIGTSTDEDPTLGDDLDDEIPF